MWLIAMLIIFFLILGICEHYHNSRKVAYITGQVKRYGCGVVQWYDWNEDIKRILYSRGYTYSEGVCNVRITKKQG